MCWKSWQRPKSECKTQAVKNPSTAAAAATLKPIEADKPEAALFGLLVELELEVEPVAEPVAVPVSVGVADDAG